MLDLSHNRLQNSKIFIEKLSTYSHFYINHHQQLFKELINNK